MATAKSKVDGSRQKTGGRKKGTPNRMTKELKEMILGALDEAGGQAYLLAQAKENPNAFLTLIGKVLPTTLASDNKNPVFEGITVQLIHADRTDTE